ncbi:MAG TPA: hypothetical protein VGY66_21495 [Gemmataceae bacterium]|jgi:hypothetical protein|nr:hypothetical protein [Gemmataceae bacterium]
MGKLLKRWYVWLGLVLVLGLAGSVALIWSGRGGITQANFDRIQKGMSLTEVESILWKDEGPWDSLRFGRTFMDTHRWNDGPNSIIVHFTNDGVEWKAIQQATAWETLQWYAKKGAAKVGVKWD